MADLPAVLQYRSGPDPRARTHAERLMGRLASADLEVEPGTSWIFGVDAVDPFYQIPVGVRLKPFVVPVADMPYSVDDNDEPFPAGTMFVCTSIRKDGTYPRQITFGSGFVETQIGISCPLPKRKQRWVYVAYGIPPGSSGTITFQIGPGGSPISQIFVDGADGPACVIPMGEYDGFPDPTFTSDMVQVTADWAPGRPVFQRLLEHPLGAAYYIAVPDTLPADYTSYMGSQFAQSVNANDGTGGRNLDTGRRLRSWGMKSVDLAGLVGDTLGLWIGNELKRCTWEPVALNQDLQSVTSAFSPDIDVFIPFPFPGMHITIDVPPPSDVTMQGPGWRRVRFKATASGTAVGRDFRFTITRSDTGGVTVIGYTETQLLAGVDDDIGVFVPSTLDPLTLTLHVDDQPSGYFGISVAFGIYGSPRCDIPLPYPAGGPDGSIAPPGYWAGALEDPVNASPCDRLDVGVTSYTPSGFAVVGFRPSANGWYKVTQAGVARQQVGEDEFILSDVSNSYQAAARGHTGRYFYAFVTAAALLQAFTPSFSAIASGGTSIATTQGGTGAGAGAGWWGFGIIILPAAGTYEITVKIVDDEQLARGVVFEWSTTDSLVVDTDGRAVWESWRILAASAAGDDAANTGPATILSTPPLGPTVHQVWIVGPSATGAWEGHDDDVAHWNDALGVWQFRTPQRDQWIGDVASGHFYDGKQWRPFTDPVIKRRITVDAATTVHCSLSAYSTEFASSSSAPHAKVGWAAV
jgi:hypothetical protein